MNGIFLIVYTSVIEMAELYSGFGRKAAASRRTPKKEKERQLPARCFFI
jgi:hypothetical protein